MKLWYASVNYGLEAAVAKVLQRRGAKGLKIMDGALTFSSGHEIDVKCINNLFLVLLSYHANNINDAVKRLTKEQPRFPRLDGKTFRLVVMDCGKLCSVSDDILSEAERAVSRKTRLSVSRAKPDSEIWLNRRSDKTVYFMVRMKKHASFDKALKKGELRGDIADVMIREAKLNKNSVVADPFGGWGAIAAAVAEEGRYARIFTGDIKNECVNYQIKRLSGKRDCAVQKWDARKLPLDSGSVDAIITDPPWGEFEEADIPRLYDGFIKEAARVLRKGGSLIFLSSAKQEACQSLDGHGFSYTFMPLKINGKETFLYTAQKI
jgi:23S rRNA G2445 N2-methylase RlmL